MDPSLSSDPHRPQQYSPFPQFPPSNNPFVSAPNLPFYGGNQTSFNTHVSPPQPQTQPQTQTPTAPPYSELIVEAIAHLNEPEGSSKMAISRYIERSNPVLPTAHAALLTHHLKTLKNCGVLSMVKKSYKLAATSSAPESVAVAAAAAAAGLSAPRSESPLSNNPDPVSGSVSGSASQPLKRGRGRPPKAKPEASPQPNAVQLNGQPSWEEQPQIHVTSPTQGVTESSSAKRGRGRPRKDGSAPIPRPAVGMSVIMKRRGRPPGRRAAGRQRKPLSVSSSASVFPYVANGARRRGRPRRVDSGVAPVAVVGGEAVAVAPGIKRGRGRPPKIGGVKNRLIAKPKRGRGRPVGRPRKNTTWPVTGATEADKAAYGELKAKLDLCNEKAKEILNVLTAGITNNDNQAVVEAAEKMEGLITMLSVEPQAVEEVQPEEAATQTEAEEPQGEGEGHGQERDGGEEEHAPISLTQVQTDAEAMQEALF
ncbi:unnamed protein product [Eruca vesicaria subsp. sativa]|uniref:H15 domain-containing protein n=1 Tax=Eruca vesicaria subsp. sativa TaxID=29727 RepID=A0ABC8LZD6_ERUVS|nr:unnamed protein product [Eruca vesicaria subsp. sativa]